MPKVLSTVTGLPRLSSYAFPPASGYWVSTEGFLGTANTAPTSGRCTWHPFWLEGGSYNGLGINVATAQVAGTVTTTLGLYKDSGTGAMPLTLGGPIVSGTVVLTATGNAAASFTATTIPTGMYWASFIYVASVAPTTAPVIKCLTNTTYAIPMPNATDLTTRVRGWARTGLTGLPTDAGTTANMSVVGATDIPVIALRAT